MKPEKWPFWRVRTSGQHWLEVVDGAYGYYADGTPLEGGWSAQVRGDGCTHLYFHNTIGERPGEPEEPDYIHICDLEDHIKRLQKLQELAREHYARQGIKWPQE